MNIKGEDIVNYIRDLEGEVAVLRAKLRTIYLMSEVVEETPVSETPAAAMVTEAFGLAPLKTPPLPGPGERWKDDPFPIGKMCLFGAVPKSKSNPVGAPGRAVKILGKVTDDAGNTTYQVRDPLTGEEFDAEPDELTPRKVSSAAVVHGGEVEADEDDKGDYPGDNALDEDILVAQIIVPGRTVKSVDGAERGVVLAMGYEYVVNTIAGAITVTDDAIPDTAYGGHTSPLPVGWQLPGGKITAVRHVADIAIEGIPFPIRRAIGSLKCVVGK